MKINHEMKLCMQNKDRKLMLKLSLAPSMFNSLAHGGEGHKAWLSR